MTVRFDMPRTNVSGTEHEATDHVPAPRKPRRFAPGLVTRRPRRNDDTVDDRRLTSRYVVRL